MKLDRNINGTGRGKYGLVNNRKLIEIEAASKVAAGIIERGEPHDLKVAQTKHLYGHLQHAISLLEEAGIIDWGEEGTESEFFVIKLRDELAPAALYRYANAAALRMNDGEYAEDVRKLADRAGSHSPFCKKSD